MFHDPVSLSEASSVLKSLSIMRRFLVPVVGDGVVQQREARLAAVAADHELPWPPKHFTPKRGRPNSDAAWVRAVQRRLLADGDLPSGVTGKRPRWWQHGMDVDKKPLEPEEVQAVTPCAEQVDVATTACAAEGSSEEVVPTATCVKTRVLLCPILKDWFLDFAGDNRERKQWSMAHSLRVARRLCPLFEKIHDDAPRKWKYSSAPSSSRLGRQPMLKPFHVTRLSEVVEEVSSQLCMGSRMYQLLMHETLSAMDCDVRPSERWTRRFLHGLGLSYKQPNHDKLVWHSLAEQADRKDNLMLKICWFQETLKIPPSHTVNIDETSLRLLPVRRVGWLRTGEQTRAITGNEKEATTVTLAMTMSPEVFTFLAQVIHKGKTSAVLPPRPWREGVLHSISANNWQHTEGIIDFIAFIDERFNPEGAASPDAKVPWLLVWDLASIHTSEATRTTLKEKFPWVSLCYIPANSTGYNQPLDVAVFKAFKSSVSWQATSTLAKEIRDTPADLSSVALNIAWKRSSLAEWVYKAMHEMSKKPALWIHAWRHLMTASEEERKVNVDRAKRAFTDNTLFTPTHIGIVPETAATCEDSMAPEDDHPEIELLHEGETEEAEADGDVEDIVMDEPAKPAAAPTKKLTALERCIALNLVYGTGARSGQFKK